LFGILVVFGRFVGGRLIVRGFVTLRVVLLVGIITIFVVSLVTPEPSKEVQELVDHVRYPNIAGDIDTRGT